MKKILVTGSNGLLGQKIIYQLLEMKTYEIIAAARGENRLNEQRGYTYHDLDITNEKQVHEIIDYYQPDVVIHPAAMTNVDACEKDHEGCYAANVLAVKYFTQALKKNKTTGYDPHFIHLSTDFVFDGKNGPYKETDTPHPLSYYAESKLESEKVVETSGLKWAIVRTIIIYGVTDGNQRSNIVLWVKNSLTNGQRINVITDQHRSPTLAEDLAQGCISIAEKGATGIYHLSGPETHSIWHLAEIIADYWKLDKTLMNPVTSQELNQPAKRPPMTGFILDKAKKDLGYQPKTFLEGLKVVDEQLKKMLNV
jgi:dTDP-4-dehydrorhamnose reductase